MSSSLDAAPEIITAAALAALLEQSQANYKVPDCLLFFGAGMRMKRWRRFSALALSYASSSGEWFVNCKSKSTWVKLCISTTRKLKALLPTAKYLSLLPHTYMYRWEQKERMRSEWTQVGHHLRSLTKLEDFVAFRFGMFFHLRNEKRRSVCGGKKNVFYTQGAVFFEGARRSRHYDER